MNDRGLIELAGKAAGICNEGFDEDRGCDVWWLPDLGRYDAWDPLNDDGDALRLAVTLGITDLKLAVGELIFAEGMPSTYEKQATVRRAIVRAAAEIGRKL